jgi:hypothetical protein
LQVRTGGLDFGVTGGSTVSGATEIISINDADNTLEPMEIRGSLFDFTGGNVGIGTTVPAYLLHVGSASASGIVVEFQNSSGACTFTPSASSMTPSCSSDRRLKNDIQDTGDALAWLRDMRVRDFTIKSTGEHKTGVIAQEMLKTHPDMVHLGADSFYKVDEPDPWKLVKAIQELKADNDKFAGSLRAANETIAELRGSFEAYKRAHP